MNESRLKDNCVKMLGTRLGPMEGLAGSERIAGSDAWASS